MDSSRRARVGLSVLTVTCVGLCLATATAYGQAPLPKLTLQEAVEMYLAQNAELESLQVDSVVPILACDA